MQFILRGHPLRFQEYIVVKDVGMRSLLSQEHHCRRKITLNI
jgi:hypothetical protein